MFKKAKVLYYVTEKSFLDLQKISEVVSGFCKFPEKVRLDEYSSILSPENFFENLIPGTILAESIQERIPGEAPEVFLCYPFHTLHFSTPLKPGEVVWFFEDEDSKKEKSNDVLHLIVNKYWVSRVCGSLISEDVNYSDYERNFLILNGETDKSKETYSGQTLPEKGEDSIRKNFLNNTFFNPSYEKSSFFDALNPDISNTSKIYDEFRYRHFYPRAIPRYFSKPHELTFQGSNNTLINLTSRNESKGTIDLIAGRLSLETYLSEDLEDSEVLSLSSLQSVNHTDISEDLLINQSFHKIKNTSGDYETFKGLKTYLGQNVNIDLGKESNNLYEYDASIVSISENNDSIMSSFNILCDNTFKVYTSNSSFKTDNIQKDFDIQNILDFNLESNSNFDILDTDVSTKPSILFKSNDLTFVARQKLVNETDEIESGSISLIKEDEEFLKESFIKINHNGEIGLDGNVIYIGNFLKEIVRKNLLTEEEVLFSSEENAVDVLDKEILDSLCGTGEGVVFGYDPKYSEPLVLGNSLNVILKDMIELNIKLIDEIDKLSKSLQTHIHVGIPASGVSGPMQDPSALITYSTESKSTMNSDLESIRNNLKFILSRFSKTS
jgi:hypothetical protein